MGNAHQAAGGISCALPVDVVERLVASQEVRGSLALPRTGVYIVRQDGHIVWASPSMEQATGRRPEDLVGRNGWDVFVPAEDLEQVARFKASLADADGILWMRIPMPAGPREWFRVDTWVREDHIVCAFRQERDRSEHHIHWERRPR